MPPPTTTARRPKKLPMLLCPTSFGTSRSCAGCDRITIEVKGVTSVTYRLRARTSTRRYSGCDAGWGEEKRSVRRNNWRACPLRAIRDRGEPVASPASPLFPPIAELSSEHQSSGLGRVFLTRAGIQFARKRYSQRQVRKNRVTLRPASSSAWRLSAAPPARPRARSTSGGPR